ncbi:hypothetical protein [Thermoflavimicrobium daqui]|jgi:hypothetical protein|uniref:Uncharacterized protein n=1 Tax=Thermoflavimicrobium daqui TaxID=2137476 RepID=A0A364K0N5_9BACL|nr:hypothetical protein [Thermoflavimicrobium daqui]RAL21059.1 hypothetical protein DL897_17385 [Thermoflavimicrobium daqui]
MDSLLRKLIKLIGDFLQVLFKQRILNIVRDGSSGTFNSKEAFIQNLFHKLSKLKPYLNQETISRMLDQLYWKIKGNPHVITASSGKSNIILRILGVILYELQSFIRKYSPIICDTLDKVAQRLLQR